MVRAHRQAWAWQDEWFQMTMDDIREMERQTQKLLAQKMNSASSHHAGFNDVHEAPVEAATDAAADAAAAATDAAAAAAAAAAAKDDVPTPSWPVASVSESSSDDDEFFDCQGIQKRKGNLLVIGFCNENEWFQFVEKRRTPLLAAPSDWMALVDEEMENR